VGFVGFVVFAALTALALALALALANFTAFSITTDFAGFVLSCSGSASNASD